MRLILGRVAFMFLLVLANLWRVNGPALLAPGESTDALFTAFGLVVGLAFIYYVAVRFAPRVIDQIRIQFFVDLCVISWLVWQTGDIISPYVSLYIVLISVAGFFLGKTETLMLAISCAVTFTALSILTAQEVVYSGSGDQPPSRILQIVGVNDVAILLVGLLAARLSERRRLSEELKHTEESFADLHLLHERIVESIGSGLITTDLSGRVYAFNRAAEEITGLKASDVVGKSVSDLFDIETRIRVEEALESWKNGQAAPVNFETKFRDADGGSGVSVVCTIVPLIGKSGTTSGLIGTFQDITQVKALEDTVRRSDRLAAVGRMAAGLAHEIRNPLGSMSSALQFLQDRSQRPAEEAALMNVVLRESERMNSIITNFLAFARPSASGTVSARSSIDAASALKDCLSLIRHSPEVTERHKILTEIPDDSLNIEADETQLKQVFWNLARNAIQAMPDGGELSVSLGETSEGSVRIGFRDTGIGMDAETLEHVFEPFASGSGGTGLGLSIVYKIIHDHGGTIDIASSPGEGTHVIVDLPERSLASAAADNYHAESVNS